MCTADKLKRHAGILIFLLTSLFIFHPAVNAQVDPRSEIFQLINQFRASRGLPPFQYNNVLATAAQGHANWMAENVLYSHTGAGGSTPLSRALAAGYSGYVIENIVGGTGMSPRQGLIWWQNSPVHYNTLVTERYPQAGVGYASNGQQNMYVLVVGRPPGPFEGPPSNAPTEPEPEPLIITPIQLAESRPDGSIVHVMQTGQALWTVAAYYDVDLAHLYLINNLTEEDVLHPGDQVTVRLADGQEPPPTPTPPLTHVIRSGESAWSIALQNGISTGQLYQLNNINENTILQPGTELIVRLAEGQPPLPTPTPRTYHTVQSGDSLWVIAAQYDLTLEQLTELNKLTTESVIRQGDQLLIRRLDPSPVPPTPTPETPTPRDTYSTTEARTAEVVTTPEPDSGTAIVALSIPTTTPNPLTSDSETSQDKPDSTLSTALIIFVSTGMLLLIYVASRIIRRL
jgi:LysM repeat protein